MNTAHMEKPEKYGRGENPSSKKNLQHKGRPSMEERWGEPTKSRGLTATETGWTGARETAKAQGYESLADFIEHMGRGLIEIPEKP